MTDPQRARDAAAAAGEKAARQLDDARRREPAVERVSWLSARFLRENHLGKLIDDALGGRA